jgi:tRNA threonylcarbamoyladenosine biosynthesis protein TsaE
MHLLLPDEAATLALGRALALALPARAPYPVLLLDGGLGAGKTTLVRGLVEALPGGHEAEVASPSFNIVNYYPTTPPVAHFDLYRLEGLPPGEDFHDALDDPGLFLVAEWAQYLPPAHRPAESLFLSLRPVDTGREARLAAIGPAAQAFLDALVAARA